VPDEVLIKNLFNVDLTATGGDLSSLYLIRVWTVGLIALVLLVVLVVIACLVHRVDPKYSGVLVVYFPAKRSAITPSKVSAAMMIGVIL
jgi:hypothetical protein